MIIQALLSLIISLLKMLFGWISLPNLPDSALKILDDFFGLINNSMGLVWIIIPKDLVMILIPIVILLLNFEKLYKLTMWIIHKLPIGVN